MPLGIRDIRLRVSDSRPVLAGVAVHIAAACFRSPFETGNESYGIT
jgi:hypothetical protein